MQLVIGIPVLLYIAWSWRAWYRSTPRFEPPRWRATLGTVSLALACISDVLCVTSVLYSLAIGGFRFYAPTLVLIIQIGLGLSLAGILASVPAKGKLRIPGLISSAAMFFAWFGSAAGE